MDDVDMNTLQRVVAALDRWHAEVPSRRGYLLTPFLRVVLDEGKSVIHYARASGVSQSVMSRWILELSTSFSAGESGLGFIEKKTSSHSLREQEVYLTAKGKRVVQALMVYLRPRKRDD